MPKSGQCFTRWKITTTTFLTTQVLAQYGLPAIECHCIGQEDNKGIFAFKTKKRHYLSAFRALAAAIPGEAILYGMVVDDYRKATSVSPPQSDEKKKKKIPLTLDDLKKQPAELLLTNKISLTNYNSLKTNLFAAKRDLTAFEDERPSIWGTKLVLKFANKNLQTHTMKKTLKKRHLWIWGQGNIGKTYCAALLLQKYRAAIACNSNNWPDVTAKTELLIFDQFASPPIFTGSFICSLCDGSVMLNVKYSQFTLEKDQVTCIIFSNYPLATVFAKDKELEYLKLRFTEYDLAKSGVLPYVALTSPSPPRSVKSGEIVIQQNNTYNIYDSKFNFADENSRPLSFSEQNLQISEFFFPN